MASFEEFSDPRLVALYDTVCPFAADTEFFLRLAARLSPMSIVDIGCGTGLLTTELARRGHQVTGVDPSAVMLDVARSRPDGDRVQWITGQAGALAPAKADLALMTGHVAQVIADDQEWQAALAGARRALRPGGRLAFDSRDPRAQAWTGWTREASSRRLSHPEQGPFEFWYQLTGMQAGLARAACHYLFPSGEELVSANAIRFRDEAGLTGSLEDAGFSVEHVYGDWDGQAAAAHTPELIFVAVSR